MESARAPLGPKIGLILKSFNLSRGAMAARLGVDKSLVGRWVSGYVTPSDYNLARLTKLVQSKLPRFTASEWDLSPSAFAAAVGLKQADEWVHGAAAPVAPSSASWDLDVAARACHEVQRYGQAYPGFYRIFRQSFSNSGTILVGCVQVLRRGDELFVRYSDGLLSYRGRIYLLNCQVFGVLGECAERDMMMFLVLNGVTAMRALQLDGLLTSVSGDKTHTPTATAVVLLRQYDLPAEPAATEAHWLEEVQRVLAANRAGTAIEQVPEDLRPLLANRVGVPDAAGGIDNVLRLPPARSVSKGIGVPLPAP